MIIKDKILTIEKPGDFIAIKGMRFKKVSLRGKLDFNNEDELRDFIEILQNHVLPRFYPPEEEI